MVPCGSETQFSKHLMPNKPGAVLVPVQGGRRDEYGRAAACGMDVGTGGWH